MFRVAAGTEMTPELLAEYMTKHKIEVSNRYQRLHDAYENKYEIGKLPKKPDWKPDNRIPVNFAKYITDTMNGFFIGIPIKTTCDDNSVSEYLEFLDQYNDQDDNNAELSKICSIYGKGYEMYYVDEEGNIGITYLTPMDAFMIYDESIIERPLFFVRHYLDSDNVEWGSWSDGRVVQHFVNRGSYKWVYDPKPHGFSGVPATEYVENDERMGIFESALPMINAYNKAISEKANDVDYFADAYLAVLLRFRHRAADKRLCAARFSPSVRRCFSSYRLRFRLLRVARISPPARGSHSRPALTPGSGAYSCSAATTDNCGHSRSIVMTGE